MVVVDVDVDVDVEVEVDVDVDVEVEVEVDVAIVVVFAASSRAETRLRTESRSTSELLIRERALDRAELTEESSNCVEEMFDSVPFNRIRAEETMPLVMESADFAAVSSVRFTIETDPPGGG